METLPLEVVEMIADNLSPKDLAACCATCLEWRNIFNQDLFWKPLITKEIGEYLATAHGVVEPTFISPEVKDSGLSGVCHQRMNHMRENHLRNNWRMGRYRKQKLEGIPAMAPDHIYAMIYSYIPIFYQEHFLIGFNFRKIEVWDLRCNPVPYVTDPCILLPRWPVYYAFLCDIRLVVVQHLAVQVFQINLLQEMWPPEHTFFFDENKPSDFISALNNIQCSMSRISPPKCVLVGNYLIAINTRSERRIHIWNIVNGLKMKKEKLKKTESWRFFSVKGSTTSVNDMILILYIKDQADTKILVYSLATFSYHPCVLDGVGYCDLHGEKIVANIKKPNDHWLISNFRTGETIHRIELMRGVSSFAEIFDSKLIYIVNGALNSLNLATAEVGQFLDAGRKIKCFQILANQFISLECVGDQESVDRQVIVSNYRTEEIWEIGKTPNRLTFKFEIPEYSFIETNSTSTKLIIEQSNADVTLISLW